MLYVAILDAKREVTMKEINEEREAWYKKGRDKAFRQMCSKMQRYEIAGHSPLRIFFVIETDDPNALNLLSHHFGDKWSSISYPVMEREIQAALTADTTIICG